MALNKKLASFNSPRIQNAPRQAEEPKRTLSVDDEQRQALEMQLNADPKRLYTLRVRYTDQYPTVENVKADIAEIPQKLASIQSAGNKEKQPVNGFGSIGNVNGACLDASSLLDVRPM